MPTPPNVRELAHGSALVAHAKKVDSNVRELLKFNIFTKRILRMFVEKYFYTSQP